MVRLVDLISILVAAGAAANFALTRAAETLPDQGTRRMAERLEHIIQTSDPMANIFMNGARARLLAQGVARAKTPIEKLNWQLYLAAELLNAGETEQALGVFNEINQAYEERGPNIPSANRSMLRMLRAVAYLRQGEQDNCLTNHTAQSCLFPIRGLGVHKVQRGSRAAIEVLLSELAAEPANMQARWLLNVAYMTLGEYPDKVPAAWLLKPELFESQYDIKRFPEVASSLGLDVEGLAGGSIAEDFDGDGYLDIMASSMALRGQLRLFHNDACGTFSDRTAAAGLSGEVGGLNIIQTDYNNDGFPDVLVLRGGWMKQGGNYPLSLLRNNGNGTFTDVTEQAGLLRFHPTQTAVWFDYNNDGWLDLFVGNESFGEQVAPCELFRNNGDGTFTECAQQMGVAVTGYVKGVTSADYNNDGWPDLYVSRHGQPNILFRNDGPGGADHSSKAPWKFTDVSAAAGVTEPIMSFPTWFFDYDNDGYPDLFVSGYDLKTVGDVAADYLGLPFQSEHPRLYHNNGDGTFTDVTKSMGLDHVLHAMGCNFGDLDNDGYLDFYLGTGDPILGTLIPNRMFRNDQGRFFQDVTTSGGFGHLQKGHGVSFADFDNDGDQDIYEVIGGAFEGDRYRNVLFENPGHGNHWICLKLEGVRSNRAAIGARIKVEVETEQGGVQSFYRTVGTGSSFGANPLRQEIGLGQAKSVRSIEVYWPATRQKQQLKGCALDRFYRVREGELQATEWQLKSFKLNTSAAGPTHQHHH